MLMVAALPDRLAGRLPQPVDAARREGLEGAHHLWQAMMSHIRHVAGGFETRPYGVYVMMRRAVGVAPYGVCVSEQHNSMHVVGHHDELIQRNMGVVPGQILPGGEHGG